MGPLQISDLIPDIELPKFSGKQQEWITFIGEFYTLIDSADLSDAVKFCYLRRCLCDNAKSAIDGFALMDYQKAIDVLHERFGNHTKNVDSHVNAICDLKEPAMDHNSLLTFYDQLQKHARILNQLNFTKESMNMLLSVVKRKLPAEVKVHVYRSCEHPQDFNAYCEYLYLEILALDAGACQVQHSQVQVGKGPCAYCKKPGHSPLYCPAVPNPSARLEVAKTDGLCFNCLGPHKLRNCRSKFTCRVCRSSHHTTLHGALSAQTQRGNVAEKAGLQMNPVIRPITRPLKEHWSSTINKDSGPIWRVLEINHPDSHYMNSEISKPLQLYHPEFLDRKWDSESVCSDTSSESWVEISDDRKAGLILNASSREKIDPQTVADCTLMDSEAETSFVDTVEIISSCPSEDSSHVDEVSGYFVHDEQKLDLNPEVLICEDVSLENKIEITDENSHSEDVHVQNKRCVSDETCEGDPRLLVVAQSHGNDYGTVHAHNLPASSSNYQSCTSKIVRSRPSSKLSMAKQSRFIRQFVMYLSLCAVILILLLWSTELSVVGDACSSYLYIAILIAVPVILTRFIVAISNFFDSNQFKVRVSFLS